MEMRPATLIFRVWHQLPETAEYYKGILSSSPKPEITTTGPGIKSNPFVRVLQYNVAG